VIGTTVSHYRIGQMLGEGGMGVVYRALDLKLGRGVALKFLREHLSQRPLSVERFRREARAASALNHPGICTIYDIDEHAGRHFIAMELLEGEPLQQRLAHGPLPVETLLELALQIADGLEAAHQGGIVHRDLKPTNLFVTLRDQVKILDFGLAKLLEGGRHEVVSPEAATLTAGDDPHTGPGLVLGTVAYMSPEQARGEQVDGRSDLFALGAVLYVMATGQQPFLDVTPGLTYDAILNKRPATARSLRPDLPPLLDSIIERALEKALEARYRDAAEVRADLARARRERSWATTQERSLATARTRAIGSVAVLPLANLSGDAGQDYFADGMTDALISDLARVSSLRVISRTSVMRYQGTRRPLPQIARELDVEAVVEGSVLRDGERVRINAQLVDGRRDQHLWAASYERELKDVLKLQAEVARAITREVRVVLTPQEQAALADARSVDPEAHEDYLLGRFHWNKRTPDALRKSLECFERALAKEPRHAGAWSGIADTQLVLSVATYDLAPPCEAVPRARAAALRALEIDDGLAEAHVSLANVKARYEWDWAAAERCFARALELNPGYAYGHHSRAAHAGAMGRHAEALAAEEKARELDPFSLIVGAGMARLFFFARQRERAVAQCRKLLELEPGFWVAHLLLGTCELRGGEAAAALPHLERAHELGGGLTLPLAARASGYAEAGRRELAQRDLAELRSQAPSRYVPAYQIAAVHASLGDREQAFAWLERARDERSEVLTCLAVDPFWDPLRSDPRLLELQRRVGLGS
jgi:serine/threonine protein kinase